MEQGKRKFIKLTVLIEDRHQANFVTEHGLSLYIEDKNKNILFDTGQSGKFVSNAKKLNIDLSHLDIIVLSHGHYDHTGGLSHILKIKKNIPIIAHPYALKDKYSFKTQKMRFIGIPLKKKWNFEFTKKFRMISENVYFLGEIEEKYKLPKTHFYMDKNGKVNDAFKDDTSLLIKGSKGISIVCGCCHKGLINTIESAKKHFNMEIDKILGGFHLIDPKSKIVEDTIKYLKKLSFNFLGLSHCTSEEVGNVFLKKFKGKTHIVKTGDIIYF